MEIEYAEQNDKPLRLIFTLSMFINNNNGLLNISIIMR